MACFMDVEQIQIFMDTFASHAVKELVVDGEKVAINFFKPYDAVSLFLDPDYAVNDIGTSGIWKSEMDQRILVGGAKTAHLGGQVCSDPWVSMIDDHGEIPDAQEERIVKGHWNQALEDSFQSVASSTKERVQIRDEKTGRNLVLTREEVITKFREDRFNDSYGFKVLNMLD